MHINSPVAGPRPARAGAAALELAVVLPLLVLLLLGACDFGRFAHTQVAVASAARAGAGQASRSQPTVATRARWEAEIQAAVREELEGLANFRANRLTVSITSVAESGGTSRASVQVSYPFRTLISWGALPDLFICRETVVFRIMEI